MKRQALRLLLILTLLLYAPFTGNFQSSQAVVPTTNSTSTATGDGVTNTFTFTFELLQAADMTVYVNKVLQTQSVAYTVQPTGGSYPCTGGTITFQATYTPANTAAILMSRMLTLTQTIALPVEGALPSSTLQTVFDRATMQIQQIQTSQLLSLQLPITSVGVNTALPTPVALNLIGWDSGGINVVNYTPQQVAAEAVVSGVLGPSTSTVGHIPTFNNTTGNLLTDSGSSIASITAPIMGLVGTANPNGNTAGTVGQRFTDKTNVVDYVCTTTGTTSSAVWLRISLPAGTIVSIWSTAAVPAGWVLCNGSNSTPNEIGMLEQGADITGGSSTANASGYTKITNQSTGGSTTISGTTGTASAQVAAGSGASSAATNTATYSFSGIANQPAVLSIVKIMKL
jgi:hypothetical protein